MKRKLTLAALTLCLANLVHANSSTPPAEHSAKKKATVAERIKKVEQRIGFFTEKANKDGQISEREAARLAKMNSRLAKLKEIAKK